MHLQTERIFITADQSVSATQRPGLKRVYDKEITASAMRMSVFLFLPKWSKRT